MKIIIKYKLLSRVNIGTEESPEYKDVLLYKEIRCTADNLSENEEIAKAEAYNGEYTKEEAEDVPAPLSIEERLTMLEEKLPTPAEYVSGTWYYRGDRVSFNDAVYTCIAPAGVVCTWSPTEYPTYWRKED